MSNRLFTQVPVPKFPRNTFSLSRSVIFTPRPQKLYCPNIIETLPGDGFNASSEQFARTQPMVAPTFVKQNADQHAFFVPFWQLNEHFDDFITGGEKGDYQDKLPYTTVGDLYAVVDSLLPSLMVIMQLSVSQLNERLEAVLSIIENCDIFRAVPFVQPDFIIVPEDATPQIKEQIMVANKAAFESLNSHLVNSTLRVNLAPFAAYLKVWCEFFRDENLCEDLYDLVWKNSAGTYDVTLYSHVGYFAYTDIQAPTSDEGYFFWTSLLGVKNRAWKKDYFTAALPFTQKGPDVLLPLSGVFPVEFTGNSSPQSSARGVSFVGDGSGAGSSGYLGTADGTGGFDKVNGSVSLGASGLGSTIIDVRRAFALEEFYEADGRGGNRYPENTLMQFGVHTPDSRLPRAQFLGSNTSPVQISEVVQTSSTDSTSPQGTLAGKGTSYGNNRLFKQFCTMHGFILNFYSIQTRAIYEQGIHPMFSRYDRTEYAWPRFAHLGEQPVYVKELFVNADVSEEEVFGYEPRYSEYKSEKSSVHGLLKGSLNFWTMSRRFANKPQLNEEFIYGAPRLDNFAVTNPLQPPYIVEIDYRIRSNRMLPFFGVPMI